MWLDHIVNGWGELYGPILASPSIGLDNTDLIQHVDNEIMSRLEAKLRDERQIPVLHLKKLRTRLREWMAAFD